MEREEKAALLANGEEIPKREDEETEKDRPSTIRFTDPVPVSSKNICTKIEARHVRITIDAPDIPDVHISTYCNARNSHLPSSDSDTETSESELEECQNIYTEILMEHTTEHICRICHGGDSEEAFISPCNCTGSMAVVHGSCMERWLNCSNTQFQCEVCNCPIPVIYSQKSFLQYLTAMDSNDRRNIRKLYSLIFFLILSVLFLTITLTASSIAAFVRMNHAGRFGRYIETIFFFFTGKAMIGFILQLRENYKSWISWRDKNLTIELDLERLRNNL